MKQHRRGSIRRWIGVGAAALGGLAGMAVAPAPVIALTALSVTANFDSVVEGNSSQTVVTITFTLDSPADGTESVEIETVDGSATFADRDYTSAIFGGSVRTFLAGETEIFERLFIVGDTKVEEDEQYSLRVSNAVGLDFEDTLITGTIVNDDFAPQPVFSITGPSAPVVEGNSGTTPMRFTVSSPVPVSAGCSLSFDLAGSTATRIDDFQVSGSSDVPAGASSVFVDLLVVGDTLVEPDETIVLALRSTPGETSSCPIIAGSTATGIIQNDDVAPPPPPTGVSVSIADAETIEGHGGTTTVVFTLTLSEPATGNEIVTATVAGETAALGSDVRQSSTTIRFRRGDTAATVRTRVIGDRTVEPDETYRVVLSNPRNLTITDGTGIGTIINDDMPRSGMRSSVQPPWSTAWLS